MPRKYGEETKAKAMRLVVDHADDYPSEYDAIRAVSGRLGMNPETLRKWLRQAEIDSGERDGVTTTSAREIRELKRKKEPSTIRGEAHGRSGGESGVAPNRLMAARKRRIP